MTEENTHDDYDSPWKDILESYFQEFMVFFIPVAADDIDWQMGHEFWDKELQQVVRDANLGRRYADKLVKVWLKNGHETYQHSFSRCKGDRLSESVGYAGNI